MVCKVERPGPDARNLIDPESPGFEQLAIVGFRISLPHMPSGFGLVQDFGLVTRVQAVRAA